MSLTRITGIEDYYRLALGIIEGDFGSRGSGFVGTQVKGVVLVSPYCYPVTDDCLQALVLVIGVNYVWAIAPGMVRELFVTDPFY